MNATPMSKLTCFFWFSRGQCGKGARCKFSHVLTDEVARYSPKKGWVAPIKVIHGRTMDETRELTFAADPNRLEGDAFLKHKSDVHSRTPIVDVLLDDGVSIQIGSSREVVNSIVKNIRRRRDNSFRVGRPFEIRLAPLMLLGLCDCTVRSQG